MPQTFPISSYYAAILFQARLNPNAIAVSIGPREISYSKFVVDIERITRRLHGLNLPRTGCVAVELQEPYVKWLCVIALARMGIVSASAIDPAKLHLLSPSASLVRANQAPGPGRVPVDPEWLSPASDDLPPFVDGQHDPDALCRIVLSSGTTGEPKKVGLTYGQLRLRNRTAARTHGLNATARQLSLVGMVTIGGFMIAVSGWSLGGTVILPAMDPSQSLADIVLKSRPNLLLLAPAQLATLLDTLPPGHWPSEKMHVYVTGSAMPRSLSERARLRLSQHIFVLYGSTEAGTVSIAHASVIDERPGFAGYVVPAAEVQIVDDNHQPVPQGTAGQIRVRSDGMAEGYLDDDGEGDMAFRDGWFYPGDVGAMTADGGLLLTGRHRELMNLGGTKLAPLVVEEVLLTCPGIDDLAVFSVEWQGRESAWAAVVPGAQFDENALQKAFGRKYPHLPPLGIVKLKQIPRNEMAKAMRGELSAKVKQMLEKRPA